MPGTGDDRRDPAEELRKMMDGIGGRNSDVGSFFDDLANGGARRDPDAQGRGQATDNGGQEVPAGTGDSPMFEGPTGGTGETGFDEEFWRKKLMGGTGVEFDASVGGGNFFGSGPRANMDLEKVLMDAGLPELDAQQLAAFAKAKESQQLEANKVFTTQKDQLMEDMFGRGMQRSTVAGEAGGRMLEGQARTMAGIEAQDAMSRLQQQNVLADRVQKGAMASADTRAKFRSAQASENAAASQANATRSMAAAQVASAEIGARSRMATTMAELDLKRELGLGDLALRESQFGQDLDYRYWAKEGEWANAMAQIKEQQPSLFDKILGFAGALAPSFIPLIPGMPKGK
jgi:hypothetical protein